jgi:hypothetical protein
MRRSERRSKSFSGRWLASIAPKIPHTKPVLHARQYNRFSILGQPRYDVEQEI